MGLSGRIPSGLDDNTFIPKEYSRNVLFALKSKLVVVPNVNHSYESDIQLGDTLYITRSQVGTATEVTVGTEGVQADPTTTGITLTINKWYERPYTVDYMSRRQSHIDLAALAEVESAYSISKKIDSSLCDLFVALNDGTIRGTDGLAWTDDILIAAVEEVDEADVDEENRVWIGDPSTRADIMKIDKFVRSDYFASDAIPTGQFRKSIYGAPLFITNNLTRYSASCTGSIGVCKRPDALAIAIQEYLSVDRVEQPLKHQLVINTTALWGIAEIRDLGGVPIYTRVY